MKATLQNKTVTQRYNFNVQHEGFNYQVVVLTDEKGKFMDEEISLNGEPLDHEGTLGQIREDITDFVDKNWETLTKLQPLPKPEAKGGCAPSGGSTATSELSEIINRARGRGCAEHGHEIKWLLELPMTDDEWKRFNDLTGWSARKR